MRTCGFSLKYMPVCVRPVMLAVPGMPLWSSWSVAAARCPTTSPITIRAMPTTARIPPVSSIVPPANGMPPSVTAIPPPTASRITPVMISQMRL
jgi:hypothetical protein